MRLKGKMVNLLQLQAELTEAGIEVPALGTEGDILHTYDTNGSIVDLPDEARPVLDAHVAVFPEVEPSRDERLAVVIETGKAAIANATTLAQVKAVFGATLDGLKSTLGGS